jgi:hypothetical protein
VSAEPMSPPPGQVAIGAEVAAVVTAVEVRGTVGGVARGGGSLVSTGPWGMGEASCPVSQGTESQRAEAGGGGKGARRQGGASCRVS